MSDQETLYDVVVVGAGFAGLTAARELLKVGKRTLVLEARDRVGGRVQTRSLGRGVYVDLGGQWIGPTQDKIYALARELGIKTFPTYNQGRNILALGDKITEYEGLIPKLDLPSLVNLDYVLKKLERLAADINLHRPWHSPDARRWDSMTLATFLDRHIRFGPARQVIDAGLETVLGCTAAEVSFLHALFYFKSGTSLDTLLNIEGGAQQDRFVGGAQLVAERLAAGFREHIRLESPVRRIGQAAGTCLVNGPGYSVRAHKVIVAIPPTLAGRIEYDPLLPARRDQLTQRMPMGTVIKCYAVYARPFWRERGLSGQVVAGEDFPVQTIFDNTPPGGQPGMLMAFALADRARRLLELDSERRRAAVLETFARFFGPEAARPRQYLDQSWADEEWSRGCYTAVMPPGAWTSFTEALRKPCGHIHWAGTETAAVWNGYIEGAIRSGERAAREVIEALQLQHQ